MPTLGRSPHPPTVRSVDRSDQAVCFHPVRRGRGQERLEVVCVLETMPAPPGIDARQRTYRPQIPYTGAVFYCGVLGWRTRQRGLDSVELVRVESMRNSPSIVPGADQDVYLVADDLGRHGRIWRE